MKGPIGDYLTKERETISELENLVLWLNRAIDVGNTENIAFYSLYIKFLTNKVLKFDHFISLFHGRITCADEVRILDECRLKMAALHASIDAATKMLQGEYEKKTVQINALKNIKNRSQKLYTADSPAMIDIRL